MWPSRRRPVSPPKSRRNNRPTTMTKCANTMTCRHRRTEGKNTEVNRERERESEYIITEKSPSRSSAFYIFSYGWVIVFASFMCNMIVDGIAYTFGVFLGEFVEYFGEGKGKVAWVGSLLSGVYLSAGPVVSALANKYGCRAVCIAGALISCVAFVLSTLSTSVNMLMLTYGVMGGFGFGLIYLPAVVAVGYYFETKRSLATGIAVCGSGFGTFTFAPFANWLLANFDWKNANLILAGLILNCAIFGALMRPLEYPKVSKVKPLMQRMYEEKRLALERGSIGGSYFMVQLPDGSMEKRMKMPINVDPGVHSSLNLEQLASQSGGLHPVATLPTITEARVHDGSESPHDSEDSPIEIKKLRPAARPTRVSESDSGEYAARDAAAAAAMAAGPSSMLNGAQQRIARNASQPAFTQYHQGESGKECIADDLRYDSKRYISQLTRAGIPKNGSVPSFDRVRKTSTSERFKPSLAAIKAGSRSDMQNDVRTNNNAGSRPTTNSPTTMLQSMHSAQFRQSASFGNSKMLNVKLGASTSVSTMIAKFTRISWALNHSLYPKQYRTTLWPLWLSLSPRLWLTLAPQMRVLFLFCWAVFVRSFVLCAI